MKKIFFVGLLFLVTLSNCTNQMATPSYEAPQRFTEPKLISQSLFKPKDSSISEADIQRLLDGKIKMPDTVRVAVLNMNSTYVNKYPNYRWNIEEDMKLQRSNFELLKSKLEETGKTKKVFLLPSLMVNQDASLQQLREAAVRMQADLLLIFHIQSDLYYKYKMFKKDEFKAFATCEALLMDVRTSVIPFSDVLTKDVLMQKAEDDFNNNETQKRAIQEATRLTLESLGENLRYFFKNEI